MIICFIIFYIHLLVFTLFIHVIRDRHTGIYFLRAPSYNVQHSKFYSVTFKIGVSSLITKFKDKIIILGISEAFIDIMDITSF